MANAQEVFMDIPQVTNIAKALQGFSEAMNTIAQILQGVSEALHATAFISFGATEAAAQFVDNILPAIKRGAQLMSTYSQEVTKAINAYQTGDRSIAGMFTG